MNVPRAGPDDPPPTFLRLAEHDVRWRLLRELSRSDRRVRELTHLLGQPQSLVSYHLNKLQADDLVSMRRSSADRRDTYYSVDLVRCGERIAAVGTALHPALRLVPPAPAGRPAQMTARARVLFLCTGNSARSQMAEAFTRHLTGHAIAAHSAGSHPKPLHPDAVAVMREHGISLDGHTSKDLSRFTVETFDYVISLCDRVREVCPEFPDEPELIHWSIADPASEGGTQAETYSAFQRTAAEVRTRVAFLCQLIEYDQSRQKVD